MPRVCNYYYSCTFDLLDFLFIFYGRYTTLTYNNAFLLFSFLKNSQTKSSELVVILYPTIFLTLGTIDDNNNSNSLLMLNTE